MNKKYIKKRQSLLSQRRYFWSLSLLIGIPLGILFFQLTHIHSQSVKRPAEDEAHVMKKLPVKVANQYKLASPSATFRVPVLMYHYVEYVKDKRDTIRQSLAILPQVFESQIKTLVDSGYTFMTAGEMGQVLDGEKVLPNKPIVLTFDDGYRDFYTDVFPILQKYKVRATSYVITGLIGGPNYMTADMVKAVAASGLVELGAHTVDHPALKGMASASAQREIELSKQTLESEYHVPAVSFAYPYGSFDLQAISLVKQAGFTTAVSTIPGVEENQADRFFIFRVRPGARTGNSLLSFLQPALVDHTVLGIH